MSEKLLPCPFCGGEAIANSDEIECAKCCAQGPLGEFRWQEWNKREPLCSDTIATLTKQALWQQEKIEELEKFLVAAREILNECADDFHRCSRCDHEDDDATKHSDLYLLLSGSLAETEKALNAVSPAISAPPTNPLKD